MESAPNRRTPHRREVGRRAESAASRGRHQHGGVLRGCAGSTRRRRVSTAAAAQAPEDCGRRPAWAGSQLRADRRRGARVPPEGGVREPQPARLRRPARRHRRQNHRREPGRGTFMADARSSSGGDENDVRRRRPAPRRQRRRAGHRGPEHGTRAPPPTRRRSRLRFKMVMKSQFCLIRDLKVWRGDERSGQLSAVASIARASGTTLLKPSRRRHHGARPRAALATLSSSSTSAGYRTPPPRARASMPRRSLAVARDAR